MKINVTKNLVELEPESSDETVKLEALWRLLVDCMRFNKKLVPLGEYIPKKNNLARFAIEGDSTENASKDEYPEAYAEKDCRAYCQTCNKYVELKKGDRIPPCCGKLMEVLD